MKKQFKLVLACLGIMLLVLSSCSLEEALNTLAGNKYIEWGLVEVDTKHADQAAQIVQSSEADEQSKQSVTKSEDGTSASIDISKIDSLSSVSDAISKLAGSTGGETGDGSTTGVTLNITTDLADKIQKDGILKAQSEEEKKALNESLSSALSGTANREALVSKLTAEAEESQSNAAKNSMALTSEIIASISNSLEESEDETVNEVIKSITQLQSDLQKKSEKSEPLTQAEVLQAQMITNLVTSVATVAASDDLANASDPSEILNTESVKTLIADATILSNTSKALSGDVDLLTVPGLTDLISAMSSSSSSDSGSSASVSRGLTASSRATEEEDNIKLDSEKNAYRFGEAYSSADMDKEEIEMQNKIIAFINNFVNSVLGLKYDGSKVAKPVNYTTRVSAYHNHSTSYDVMFNMAKGDVSSIAKNKDAYASLKQNTSMSKAIDFALSSVISLADSMLKANGFDLYELINEIYILNPWIGKGAISDGDYFYLPKDFVEKFDLNEGGDTMGRLMLHYEEQILAKATTLDKMMAVGDFDMQSLMKFMGFDMGEGEDIASITTELQKMFKDINESLEESK